MPWKLLSAHEGLDLSHVDWDWVLKVAEQERQKFPTTETPVWQSNNDMILLKDDCLVFVRFQGNTEPTVTVTVGHWTDEETELPTPEPEYDFANSQQDEIISQSETDEAANEEN